MRPGVEVAIDLPIDVGDVDELVVHGRHDQQWTGWRPLSEPEAVDDGDDFWFGEQVGHRYVEVVVAHPAPAPLESYRAFVPLPAFNADSNFIQLNRDILDLPLPQADPYAAAATQEQCRHMLAQRRARSGYAGQVRDRLVQQPGNLPDLEAVASELHMSSRTLRRNLTKEGTSYRSLVDEVRERLADELLATGALSVAEIGRRLGYADTPSFTSAFKRWKGDVPPRTYAKYVRQQSNRGSD